MVQLCKGLVPSPLLAFRERHGSWAWEVGASPTCTSTLIGIDVSSQSPADTTVSRECCDSFDRGSTSPAEGPWSAVLGPSGRRSLRALRTTMSFVPD